MSMNNNPNDGIMPGAEPFTFPGDSPLGALVLHGFEGSPFEVRGLGEALHKEDAQGMIGVEGPLLPGHGTRLKDMHRVERGDWLSAAEQAARRLRERHSKVLGVGFSMGGTLLLRLQAEKNLFDALVTINSPLFLRNWRLRLLPMIRIFPFVYTYPRRQRKNGEECPWVGYREGYSIPAVKELTILLKECRAALPRVRVPTLVIQSQEDGTVPHQNGPAIRNLLGTLDSQKRLEIISNPYHLITTNPDSARQVERLVTDFAKGLLDRSNPCSEKS